MNRLTTWLAGSALVAGAVTAALLLPTAFAAGTPSYDQNIYKLTFRGGAATDGTQTATPEWVSLKTGTWRVDADDQSFISSDSHYVVIDRGSGSVYHRTGTGAFMGDLHDAPDGALALRAYLQKDTGLSRRGLHLAVGKDRLGKTTLDAVDAAGKKGFSVTIDQRVTDQEAAAAHLLEVTPGRPAETDTEVAVGKAPAAGVTAYWLGSAVDGRRALTAAQHLRVRTEAQVATGMTRRGEVLSHVTFYERGGVQVTSAQPGVRDRPAGELQVSSEPLDSAHAQGLVAAMNGQNADLAYPAWPRSTAKLPNGQQIVVVPSRFDGDGASRSGFFVLTPSTLVSVSGEVAVTDIPSLAAKLRPIG